MSVDDGPGQVRIGIVGLGVATALMLPTLTTDPRLRIAAVAEPREEARAAFSAQYGVPAYASADRLLSCADIDAVYIGTPHGMHVDHAVAALYAGKHVVVEKPLGLTLADCRRVVDAQSATGRSVVVGHTHGFDPTVRAMRELIDSGRIGRVLMVGNWAFTDFLYRPRRPEELDTSLGGGIVFNQLPHQVEVARVLAGRDVVSVRSAAFAADPARGTEGAHTTFLQFEDGAVATLVYSGHDFYDSDELFPSSSTPSGWVSEIGGPVAAHHGAARRALRAHSTGVTEEHARAQAGYRPGAGPVPFAGQEHFGVTIVNAERGDLRTTADGFVFYDEDGLHEIPLPRAAVTPDRSPVVDELCESISQSRPSRHDAAWGMATVEVCLAVLESSRQRREVALRQRA